jgi:hypothetical protein
MARTPTKLRLRDVDPEETAQACVAALVEAAEQIAKALRPGYELVQSHQLAGTEIAKAVTQLGNYATKGTAIRADVETLIERLSALRTCADVVGSLSPAEPVTPLEFIIAGARARAALEAGQVLTSLQLAILSGLDRDHVNGMALKEQIPSAYRSDESKHRPWRFRNTKALREWVSHYTAA